MSSAAYTRAASTKVVPPWVYALVAPVITLGVGLSVIAALEIVLRGQTSSILYALVFLGLATLAEAFPAPVGVVTGNTSLSIIAIVPATVLLGWTYATVIAFVAVLLVTGIRRNKPPVKVLYNGAMFATAAAAAGLAGTQLEGISAILVAAVAYYLVNITLLMAVVSVTSGPVNVMSYLRTTVPQFLVLGSVTSIFFELWTQRPWLVALILGPIVAIVAHQRAMHEVLAKMQKLDVEKDDFISYASHELRTPITIISGAAETIRQHTLDAKTKERMEELIYEGAIRLSHMTDLLLDMNRMSKRQPDPRPVNLSKYLTDLVERLNLGGRVLVSADASVVSTDPELLDRVVSNLVTNAVKYGADPITVEAHATTITVTDRGPGVASDFQERMFKRFTRASNDSKGCGLGLALAASYAELLGGTVSYEDAQPGAKFIVSLP